MTTQSAGSASSVCFVVPSNISLNSCDGQRGPLIETSRRDGAWARGVARIRAALTMKLGSARWMTLAVIAALTLITGSASRAQTCPTSPSYSPDFTSNQSCMTLLNNGSSSTAVNPSFVSGSAGAMLLQITPNTPQQRGYAWYNTPQPVGNSFSTTFTFQLTGASNPPADGFAFVIQNSSAGASTYGPTGSDGCGLGFGDDPTGDGAACVNATGGITNSVAVGFKTFNSGAGLSYPDSVFIASNGTGANCVDTTSPNCVIAENDLSGTSFTANSFGCSGSGICLADGNVHTVTITYALQPTAAQSACYAPANNAPLPCLDVILDGTDLFPAGVPFNMTSIGLTNNTAYAGFTGATGGSVENNDILSWTFTPQSFGTINVCPGPTSPAPCSNTLPETFSVPAGTTISSVSVLTQGVSGLDFSVASPGTCTGTYVTAGVCTASITFTPQAPGLRQGAIELFGSAAVPAVRPLFGSAATPLATTLIYGIGQGPAIAFGPGTQTALVGVDGVHAAREVALDGAGDLFIAENLNNQVVELPAGGGAQTTVGTGLSGPYGVAVDGAGDVFIADTSNNRVVKVAAGGGAQTTVASGLNSPLGVTVDAAGDLFIADTDNNQVLELPASGGSQRTVASGLNNPNTVVVDSKGDLFIVDSDSQLVEIPAGCAIPTCWARVGTGLSNPRGAAVDAAGDVFIADTYASLVIEIPAGGGPQTTVGAGFGYPWGVAVDGAGDVFITDTNDGEISEVNRSLPPSLTFAPTYEGSTSTDSPQAVSVQNVGNATLNFATISFPPDFPQVGDDNDCSTGTPLTPGLVCPLTIDFKPTTLGSPLSEVVGLTDNALNAIPSATQSILVEGNGLSPEVNVPNLVGQMESGVAGLLPTGLTLGTVSSEVSTLPIGQVLSQNPGAGTQVQVGSSVSIVVSSGVPVPNVVGLLEGTTQTEGTAEGLIAGAGLTVGNITIQFSDTVPSGTVLSQNPAFPSNVNTGTSVSLVVTGIPPQQDQLFFENNYFVTGDYATGGVTLHGTASGTITIQDASPCAAPACGPGVPDGADIIDGFLYWTTIEPAGSTASGNSGTFLGYSITGQQVGSDVPNYSDGTYTGILRVYRADVNNYFQVRADWNGARQGSGQFNVTLPNSGGTITEGASLVVIYRVLSPNFPLKSVVIYDGSIAPTSATGNIPQALQGFYDAVGGPSGMGEVTHLYTSGGSWNDSESSQTLGYSNQYIDTLDTGNAYAAVILSTPVNNSDNDGILDAWKAAQGYTDVKTGSWVALPGATHGEQDLFVQFDYMCSALNSDNTCDFTQFNLYPSPDAQGNDPLAMVTQAFANYGVHLHLKPGNAILETPACMDNPGTQTCEFPNQPGVVAWNGSVELSKVWPINYSLCTSTPSLANCTPRFPYGQKDSYHYVLFGYSLAIPAWTTRAGSITSITTTGGTNGGTGTGTIVTKGLGTTCPTRITISGVQGNPNLNAIYNGVTCDSGLTTMYFTTSSTVPTWTYPNNTLPEPVIAVTSGTVTSISGYSDLGGSDSVVSLGQWESSPTQDMSKSATVVAGTLFHEIGHTLGLSHGGLYFDTPGTYIPTFEANCKPNYQSSMNYLFQLDGVGPNAAVTYSNQALYGEIPGTPPTITILGGDSGTANPNFTTISLGSVANLTDQNGDFADFPTSAWYTTTAPSSTASAATMHCDGSPLKNNDDIGYRVTGPVDSISPAWSDGQNITFDGAQYSDLRGYSDKANLDLRQVGATSGDFASLASETSYSSNGVTFAGSGGVTFAGSGGVTYAGSGGVTFAGSGGVLFAGSGGVLFAGSGGVTFAGSGGVTYGGSGGVTFAGSGGVTFAGSGGVTFAGSGGVTFAGSGGESTNELDYLTANSFVRPPNSPTITPVMTGQALTSVVVDWKAPAFGVVQYYTVYRGCNLDGSDGQSIGVVNGVGGAAPATEFIDSNPGTITCSGPSGVVYTIGTTLASVQIDPTQRSSAPSVPAIVKNLQTIVLSPLQSSVTYSTSLPPVLVTATAETNGNPNGLQVNFVVTGPCSVSVLSVSTANVSVNDPGSNPATCTITASQPGTNPTATSIPPYYDAANSVSESFTIEPANSNVQPQTISWSTLPNVQYGSTFSLSATAKSNGVADGQLVTFTAAGPCTTSGTTTGVGPCTITATAAQGGTGNYSSATVSQSFNITPAVLTVTAASPTISYGQPLPSLIPSLNVNYSITGFVKNGLGQLDTSSVVAGAPALSTTATATSSPGNYPITISTGSLAAANYSFLYVPGVLNIQQASQTITFTMNAPAAAAYNGSFTVVATGGASGQPVTFTSGGSCTNSGTTYTMTSGTGTCTVIANQASSTDYSAAQTVTQTVNATLATPAITFTGAPPSAAYNSHFTVAATTKASTTPTITSSGACSNMSTAVTMTSGTGTCLLTATWAADSNYSGATATQSTTASTIAPTITFTGAPTSAAYNSIFAVAATTNASTTPTITSSGACSNVGTAITMTSGTGICSLSATWAADSNYSSATATQSTTASKIAPTITFTGAPASAAYNSKFTVAATTKASTTATITSSGACSNVGTAITMTSGTGTCLLTATWAADTNYSGATATQSTTATLAPAAISISNLTPTALIGGTLIPTYSYNGNGVPKVTSSTPGVCSVSGATVNLVGVGSCVLTASAPATSDYAAAIGSAQSLTVVEAPAITSANSATFTVGTSGTFTVTATSYPAASITESGALPSGITYVNNNNGTGTLSGKATVSGIYPITFTAQNGVGAAATQSFTLTSETTVPASSTTCNGVYIGTFSGNIIVSSGQNCIFEKGGATGNITETGGILALSNSTIGGNIQVSGGTYAIGPSTTIKGNLTIQSIPTGSAQNLVCGTTVGGSLTLQSVGTAATIGTGSPACPANTISGSLTLQANKAAVVLDGNTIKGSVTDQSNTAATTLTSNAISGSLTDQGNSGASVVSLNSITGTLVDQSNSASSVLSGNTVGQTLTDQGNTGPTQVTSNKVTGILLCQSNTSITGSGDTASKLEGQCSSF